MEQKPTNLEAMMHKVLREMALSIAKEHGVYLTNVSFNWYDHRTIAEAPSKVLDSVDVQTRS